MARQTPVRTSAIVGWAWTAMPTSESPTRILRNQDMLPSSLKDLEPYQKRGSAGERELRWLR